MSLPGNACEPSVLKLVDAPHLGVSGSTSLVCRLLAPPAPSPSDLLVLGMPTNVFPGFPFEFFVVPREGYLISCPEEAAVFSKDVAARLRISMTLPDAARVDSKTPVAMVRALADGCGVRVTVPFMQTTPSPTITLDSMTLVGMRGAVSGPPNYLHVGANHDAAVAGRVWRAAIEGNAAGVFAALCDGCSTEEANDMSECRLTPCLFGMRHHDGFDRLIEMDEIENLGKPKKLSPVPYEPRVPDPRFDYQVALIAAAEGGHLDVVRVLVNAGADTTAVYPYEVSWRGLLVS